MNNTNIIIRTCLNQVDLLLADMRDGADHEEEIEVILDAVTEHFELDYIVPELHARRAQLADLLTGKG